MRIPTAKQYHLLRILGSGAMVIAPGRADWEPLLKHGWVAPTLEDDPDKRYLPPLRITPTGLVALAAAVRRYGHIELDGAQEHHQLNEAPGVTKLRRDLDVARRERDQARRDAHTATAQLARIRRLVEEAAA